MNIEAFFVDPAHETAFQCWREIERKAGRVATREQFMMRIRASIQAAMYQRAS